MQVGSYVHGGHNSKLKIMMTLFFFFLTGNKFALIHVAMMRMCNEIKTKASNLFHRYFLCLFYSKGLSALSVENYVFSSQNITGVRKCKYWGKYKKQNYL